MSIHVEENYECINKFLLENDAHPLASIEWGHVRELEGHKVYRLVFMKKEEIIIYTQLIAHKLPGIPFFIGEVWKGPIFSKKVDIDKEILDLFFSELKSFCANEKILVVKMEPQIEESSHIANLLLNIPILKKGEPTNALATVRIDLTKDIDDLNMKIDKYTRKNIRRSENRGVTVNIITDKEAQIGALDTLYDLLKVTSNRAGIRVRNKNFYQNILEQQDQNFKIYIIEAVITDKVISSFFVITYGNGIFTPYSGSRRDLNEYKGNELINWRIIKLGKELNLKYYDQWGVLKANASNKDPLQGVTNFKLSFGGQRIEYIGALDLVIYPLLYKIFSFIWYLRKLMKSIIR